MRRTHVEGGLVEIDVDDLLEETMGQSTSETEEADAGAFDFVKHGRGDGSSPSGTTEQDPSQTLGKKNTTRCAKTQSPTRSHGPPPATQLLIC
jgi:hypothetical protein